jgi:hypothetical protein
MSSPEFINDAWLEEEILTMAAEGRIDSPLNIRK